MTEEFTLGEEFRSRSGGLGVWRITGVDFEDGESIYRLTNAALGVERRATAEMIRERLE